MTEACARRRFRQKPAEGRRRRSYRRLLVRKIVWRYAGCLVLVGLSLVATPLLAVPVYAACGFCLGCYIGKRAIWIVGDPAQKIADDRRLMVLLWPVQAARYLRLLRTARPRGAGGDFTVGMLPRAGDIA